MAAQPQQAAEHSGLLGLIDDLSQKPGSPAGIFVAGALDSLAAE